MNCGPTSPREIASISENLILLNDLRYLSWASPWLCPIHLMVVYTANQDRCSSFERRCHSIMVGDHLTDLKSPNAASSQKIRAPWLLTDYLRIRAWSTPAQTFDTSMCGYQEQTKDTCLRRRRVFLSQQQSPTPSPRATLQSSFYLTGGPTTIKIPRLRHNLLVIDIALPRHASSIEAQVSPQCSE